MRLCALLAVGAFASCAAQSDTGDGSYFISKQAPTESSDMGDLREEVLREALARCGRRLVVIVEERRTQPPYSRGNYPRIDLTFRCE
jgi:hypothetical protein